MIRNKFIQLGIFAVFFITVMVFLSQTVFAATTKIIPYQGKLTNVDGTNVTDGSYNFRILFYDAITSGSCVYAISGTCGTPTDYAVTIANGIFYIAIGDTGTNSLSSINFNQDLWMEVRVNGETLTPRKRVSGGAFTGFSNLTDPTANTSLSFGSNTSTFTFGNATGSNNLFNIFDTANNTGTGALLNIQTGASSAALPLRIRAGSTESIYVSSTGNVSIGSTTTTSKLNIGSAAQFQIDSSGNTALGTAVTTGRRFLVGGTTINNAIAELNGTFSTTGNYQGTIISSSYSAAASIVRSAYITQPAAAGGTVVDKQALYLDNVSGGSNSNAAIAIGGNPTSGTWSIYSTTSNNYFATNTTIGSTTTTSLFNVGSSAQFQVNSTGNIIKLNNVTTSFPSSNSSGVLTNNGSGTLTWASAYATIQDEGSALTQRSTINFIGSGVSCADNVGNTRTDCTINTASNAFVQDGNSFAGLATLGTNDSNALAIETNGTERARLTTTGKLGIGNTSPTTFLQVNGGISGQGDIVVDTNGGTNTGTGNDIGLYETDGDTLTSAAGQGLCTNSLTSPTAVYKDGNGDCTSGNGGSDTTLFLEPGTTIASATTAVTSAWAFNDTDTDCNEDGTTGDGGCTASDGIYQSGQNLFIDNTPTGVFNSGFIGINNNNPKFAIHSIGTTNTTGMVLEGQGSATPNLIGRRARGNGSNLISVQNGDTLFIIQGRGYGTTGWSTTSRASIRFTTSEAWTDTAQGTRTVFRNTLSGSTTNTFPLRLENNGNIMVGADVLPTARLEITPDAQSAGNALRINPYGVSAGNTGEAQFMELVANGSNYVGFKAADNIGGNVIWTLPSADASGFLQSNGSGTLTWASAYATIQDEGSALTQRSTINFIGSGVSCADNVGNTRTDCTINSGGAPSGTSGQTLRYDGTNTLVATSLLYNNGTNIGINTGSPNYKLDINAGGAFTGVRFGNGTSNDGGFLTSTNSYQATISGGSSFNGTSWVARSTASAILDMNNGVLQYYADTGLTAGNTFTPTSRLIIDATGDITKIKGITYAWPSANATANSMGLLSTTGGTLSWGNVLTTIQDEGSTLTQRPTINFIGSGVSCADNVGNTRTDCTISVGSVALNAITAATNTNTINNVANLQNWQWQSLTTGGGLLLSGGSAMTTGNVLTVGTSTTFASNAGGDEGHMIRVVFADNAVNNTGTTTVNGVYVFPSISTAGGGSKIINSYKSETPTLTGCASGTCTINGFYTKPQTNSNALITQNGFNLDGSSYASSNGALNGINIGSISSGGSTDTAINISASGWDNALVISNTSQTTQTLMTVTGGTAVTTGGFFTGSATFATAGATTANVYGLSLTHNSTNTSGNAVVNGFVVSPAISTSGATGTKEFNSFLSNAPTLTGCSGGNCTISGHVSTIQGSGTLSNITQNGFTVVGSGVSAGAANGINISTITNSTGTETGIQIGQGWDTGLRLQATSAFTQTTPLSGILLDYSTNFTGTAGQNITGISLTTPALSTTGATTAYTGITLGTAGALNSSTAGSITFTGINLQNPAITQAAGGSATANGLTITTAGITTAGTQRAINIASSGVGAGTLTGVNISAITAGAGTEYAIVVGSGWDAVLRVNTTTILNATGVLQSAALSGTYSSALTLSSTSNAYTGASLTLSSTGQTTGNIVSLTGGTAATTGSVLTIPSVTYATAAGGTGNAITATLTHNSAATSSNTVVNGVNVTGTLNTSGATGTKDLNLHNATGAITGCTGGNCILSYYKATTASTNAAATITQNGLNIVSSGISAGTLNGVNISGITAGAGTETAINIASGWDNYIAINTNTFVVTGAGRVGIGTNPNELLEVNGNIRLTPLNGGGLTTASIDNNGNLIRTASDVRLKTNITTITNALEKVTKLRGVTYNWRDTQDYGAERDLGLIAQEVELVVPEVVRKDRSADQIRSLNYGNLVGLLVEAIKEQQAQITALKNGGISNLTNYDINKFYVGTNGYVGIGTTSPTANLDIKGNINITGNGSLFINGQIAIDGVDGRPGWYRSYGNTGWYNSTYGGGIYMQDTDWLRNYGAKPLLLTGNNNIAAVFQNGKVGIGTDTPIADLDVKGSVKIGEKGTPIQAVISNTFDLDFSNLAPNTSQDLEVTLDGATINASVIIGLPANPPTGVIFTGFVSTENKVKIRATNILSTPINIPDAKYRITVENF